MPRNHRIQRKARDRHIALGASQRLHLRGRKVSPYFNAIQSQPIRNPRDLLNEAGSGRQANVRADDQVRRPRDERSRRQRPESEASGLPQREVPVASHFGISRHGHHSHAIASKDNV